jgi:ribosome-binding factor A
MLRERGRHLRVAAELQRVVNELLQLEVKDPRLDGVRISAVEVSGDLGVAKLFYGTLHPDDSLDPIEQALRAAAGFIRGRVGHAIRLRRVPELRFVHDESARRGADLSRLIAEQHHSDAEDDGNPH